MATIRTRCPHCLQIERIGIYPATNVTPINSRGSWLACFDFVPSPNAQDIVISQLYCNNCFGISIGIFTCAKNMQQHLNSGIADAMGIDSWQTIKLIGTFPPAKSPVAPIEVPVAAGQFYSEAKEDLMAGRTAAGIIAKCRSVLDLCLKDLNASGKSRRERITDLASRGLLTAGLSEWSQRLWDDGNDAIHDLVGSKERAAEHIRFLELFFEVTYELPAQVARAQAHDASVAATP